MVPLIPFAPLFSLVHSPPVDTTAPSTDHRGGVYSSLYATSVDHVAESVGAGGARAARVRNRTRKDGLGPLIEYRLHKLDRPIKFENTCCYHDVSISCTFHICSENISQCPFESVQ